MGGLGNQMFIYATAKALALRGSGGLVLDTQSGYKNDLFNRIFLLDFFGISYQRANIFYRFDYWQGDKIKAFWKKLHFSVIPLMKYILENNSYDFVDELWGEHSLSLYLDGYFQSEDYFNDFSAIIKSEFQFPLFKDFITIAEKDEIEKCEGISVAVGVRRYQEMPLGQKVIKVTELEFYLKSIEYILSHVDNPVFFVFCEEQEWVLRNFPTNIKMRLISAKSGVEMALNDMYLMSLCKHHVISNSSFYWWGAWLAEKEDSIIIASDCFLNSRSIPDRWIKM